MRKPIQTDSITFKLVCETKYKTEYFDIYADLDPIEINWEDPFNDLMWPDMSDFGDRD